MEDFSLKVSTIDFNETKEIYDAEANIRIYCKQHKTVFALQLRFYTEIKKGFKVSSVKKNMIATVTLSPEEILQMAEFIKEYMNQ